MSMNCENIIGLEVGRSSLERLKMKIKDLLDEVEEMDSMGGGGHSVVQYLTEMVEENKILNKKCRELAHLVKNLKRERRECLIVPKLESCKHQSEILDQYERERLELHDEVESLRSELLETRNIVQLLTAQVMTYKEDFEMERRDRERAIEKINVLEGRLLEDDEHAHLQRHNTSSGLDFETTNNHHHHHHQARHERDCEHAELLIPRSFGELGRAPQTERAVSPFSAISSHGDKSGDDNKMVLNPNKRKLNHADSFDKVVSGKLPSLE